jgi:hypothetical protein
VQEWIGFIETAKVEQNIGGMIAIAYQMFVKRAELSANIRSLVTAVITSKLQSLFSLVATFINISNIEQSTPMEEYYRIGLTVESPSILKVICTKVLNV